MNKPIAVVGSRPDGNALLVEVPLVAFHNQLMSAADGFRAVGLIERLYDISPEEVAGAAWGDGPALNLFWVRPEQIAHGAIMRHLNLAVNGADLVQRIDGRRQPAMDAEQLIVNERRQAKIVKDLCAVLPNVLRAVLFHTLVIEAVDLGDLSALMVAADQRHAMRVSYL